MSALFQGWCKLEQSGSISCSYHHVLDKQHTSICFFFGMISGGREQEALSSWSHSIFFSVKRDDTDFFPSWVHTKFLQAPAVGTLQWFATHWLQSLMGVPRCCIAHGLTSFQGLFSTRLNVTISSSPSTRFVSPSSKMADSDLSIGLFQLSRYNT